MIPTAIVLDPVQDCVVPPSKLRMAPRIIFNPFPIQSVQTHLTLKKHRVLQGSFNDRYIEAIFSLLAAFSAKLDPSDEFAPLIANINRGVFLSRMQYIDSGHITLKVDECTPSLTDTGVVRQAFPSLAFKLPKGVSMTLHIYHEKLPSLRIATSGLTLTIHPAGGAGSPTNTSPWKRRFPARANPFQINGLLFSETLAFGGLSLLKINTKERRDRWSFEDMLSWFIRVYEWINAYLDWMDSDEEIPSDELFELVDEVPPHYRYARGAIPPGNGEIVFELER